MMIIKYYKGYINKNELQDLTKTTKEGTTAYNLKLALTNIGFSVKGVSCKLEDITCNNIILPCIANVTINKLYKHFVVIYEINFKHKYIIVADPKDKIKKIKYEDFDKIFNDVLLIFFPIKKLPINKNISKLNFYKTLITPHKKELINIIILSLFVTIFSIINSFYTQNMIDSINSYSMYSITYFFIIFLIINILKIITEYFRNISLTYINQKLDLLLTLDIFNKIIKLPYHYYKNRTTGDIVSRVNDLENIRNIISKVALSIFIDLPLTVIALIAIFIINKTLFIIGIIILILYYLIIILFRSTFNEYIMNLKIKNSDTLSYMIESINNFESIKGIHMEDIICNKLECKYVSYLTKLIKYQKLYFIKELLKDLINNIGFIIIIFIGCILVINNKISLGGLFTFTSLLSYFLEPIKNIINLDTNIKDANISLKRLLELMGYSKKEDGIVNKFTNGDIIIRNLNYTFDDRNYILKKINLHILNKSKIMIIGKSGSGKSTLFKTLMKYYKVKNNKIFIGGIDLNKYTKSAIDNNIIYISQNETLFTDTLINNVNFNNSDSSKVIDVFKMCYVDSIFDKNLGYNILIEEGGFNLSGGEKQRVVLARSLLQPFNILIIDEALNQVDIKMERKILKNVFNYFKDKTIIVISHRLDNADLFDKLIKIENKIAKEVIING